MDLTQPAAIRARSREQAMDWSLVLVSQGIEPFISKDESDGTWNLVVPLVHRERALRALRQYVSENRRHPWRKEVLASGLLFDLGSLAWVALLILFHWLDAHYPLRSSAMMDAAAVNTGEWWRLFTAVWLHADVGHLAANATSGFVLLGLTMGRYGTGCGLLAGLVAGAFGNIAGLVFGAGSHRSLGASGMVMGCLGLLAGQSVLHWLKIGLKPKFAVAGLAAGTMLFVLFGLAPQTDVLAHFGGFASGVLMSLFLSRVQSLDRREGVQVVCGIGVLLMVTIPWLLAISRLRATP